MPTMPHLKPMSHITWIAWQPDRPESVRSSCRQSVARVVVSSRGRRTVLAAEPLGVHRKMHLVLKARILAAREQVGVVGDDSGQRLDPAPLALGEVAQHIWVYQFLDAGM